MSEFFTWDWFVFFKVFVALAVLQLMPIRWACWAAVGICAAVFVAEGQPLAFFSTLGLGHFAARRFA